MSARAVSATMLGTSLFAMPNPVPHWLLCSAPDLLAVHDAFEESSLQALGMIWDLPCIMLSIPTSRNFRAASGLIAWSTGVVMGAQGGVIVVCRSNKIHDLDSYDFLCFTPSGDDWTIDHRESKLLLIVGSDLRHVALRAMDILARREQAGFRKGRNRDGEDEESGMAGEDDR